MCLLWLSVPNTAHHLTPPKFSHLQKKKKKKRNDIACKMLEILGLKIEILQDVTSTPSLFKEIWYFLCGWYREICSNSSKEQPSS